MVSVPQLTRSGLHPRTAQSLTALWLPQKSKMARLDPYDRPTASARSDVFRRAKELKVEALLFIDSDMEFQEDSYERLKRVPGDIVCGLFFNKTCPSYPTIIRKKKAEDGKTDLLVPITPDGKVQDVDGCGMAFTLIRKRVIESIEYPAFPHTGWMSEDYVFCLRCRERGFTIRCDTGLLIAHRGDIAFCGQPALSSPESVALSFPFGTVNERESVREWK